MVGDTGHLPAVAFNAKTVIRNGHAGASLDDNVFHVLPQRSVSGEPYMLGHT